ncbi:hypothetical protein [Naasia lichenicola]|uniref:Uncharacterized protein n=1 Tax=Naasia lichenicola TaxID=2565933 RepID=A0A4V3WTU9_9MICO|nr:hypothetical protein [Naasia lichenicola]THG33387.1 hypothetical protein E6C64_03300 [Naasia lichenicola]
MTVTEDPRSVPDSDTSEPSTTLASLSAHPTELSGEWVVRPAAPVDTGIAAFACIREETGGYFLYPSLPGFPRSGPFEAIPDALIELAELLTSAGLAGDPPRS